MLGPLWQTHQRRQTYAQSTMTALLGRMAAYTGRTLSWDWAMKASKLDLTPKEWKFGNLLDPIAVPGETDLV